MDQKSQKDIPDAYNELIFGNDANYTQQEKDRIF